MKNRFIFLFILGFMLNGFLITAFAGEKEKTLNFEFYGSKVSLEFDSSMIIPTAGLSQESIQLFYNSMKAAKYQPIITSLTAYKNEHQLNDWLYYQLIRKTAQQISPKSEDYIRYTLYKWFLLAESGYDAQLAISNDHLYFFVRCEEEISDIPFFKKNGKQYVCLNIHDYNNIDLQKNELKLVDVFSTEAKTLFSYKVTRMPDFSPESYSAKMLKFKYGQKDYHFQVMLNPEVETIFKNYPGVSFETYFNIPLSREAYSSLIPMLRKTLEGKTEKKGVDYLMKFTRNAFLYEPDEDNFGREKRLSPEQTLFNKYSDCDDRAALFFYLVKEIYQLPMIALLYPTHITMAVQFNKPLSNSITYKGQKYSICEPTPQEETLKIGQISSKLKNEVYTVVYQYNPDK